MITFPEFRGRAEKFQEPIYIREEWYINEKPIYLYFKVIGYTELEELIVVYVMLEPGDYYTITNDVNYDTYFRDSEERNFSLITKEEFDTEFEQVLSILKGF